MFESELNQLAKPLERDKRPPFARIAEDYQRIEDEYEPDDHYDYGEESMP